MPGLEGTRWVTDLAILNTSATEYAEVFLYLLENGKDNLGAVGHRISVGPGHVASFKDAVGDLLGSPRSSGALLLGSDQPLKVTSRTYNDAAEGTYGQFIPALTEDALLEEGESMTLIQLTGNEDYRTNIGFVNLGTDWIYVNLWLYQSDGTSVGTELVPVPPYGFIQHSDILGTVVEDGYAMVSSSTGGARYAVYASVVDNRTGDPMFVLPSMATVGKGERMYLPGLAHVEGFEGTSWRSDLEVCNPGAETAGFWIELLREGYENTSPLSRYFNLAGGQSVRYRDALESLFGFDGSATVRIVPAEGSITASCRTYNLTASGTYGQFIPGIPDKLAVAEDDEVRIIQLSESAVTSEGFRTNIGFVNTTDDIIELSIAYYDASGSRLTDFKREFFGLGPNGYVHISRILRHAGVEGADNYYVVLGTTTEEGNFLAYASVVDNKSGDPVFLQASRDGDSSRVCGEPIIIDDEHAEGNISPNPYENHPFEIAQRFTPDCYPFVIESVQLGLTRDPRIEPYYSFYCKVVVYDDDGSNQVPGTLLASHYQELGSLPVWGGVNYHLVRLPNPVVVENGSVWVGLVIDSQRAAAIAYDKNWTQLQREDILWRYYPDQDQWNVFPAALELHSFLIRLYPVQD